MPYARISGLPRKARNAAPEVLVGLLPGAGGTQRITRLIGAEAALEVVALGKHIPARECLRLGMIDRLAEAWCLRATSAGFREESAAAGRRFASRAGQTDKVDADRGRPEIFENFRKANERKFRGFEAPELSVGCVEAASLSVSTRVWPSNGSISKACAAAFSRRHCNMRSLPSEWLARTPFVAARKRFPWLQSAFLVGDHGYGDCYLLRVGRHSCDNHQLE